MIDRKSALETIIAGGLIAVGCAAGAPVAALVGVIGGVGGNWAADLAIGAVRTWSDHWFTPAGALNGELRGALGRAFAHTFRTLEQDYRQSGAYLRLEVRDRQAAKETCEQLRLLAADADHLLADEARLTLVMQGPALETLRQPHTANGLPERNQARRALIDALRAWLWGHDAGLIEFVSAAITDERLDELALRFFDELKRSTPEGTAAWRAWQLLEQRSYQHALAQLTRQGAETAAATAWLVDWANRLQRSSAEQVDLTGLVQLPASIVDLQQQMAAGFDGLRHGQHKISQQLDELDAKLTPRLAPPTPPALETPLLGRQQLLARLEAELCAQPDAPHAAPLALSALRGMPGVGKTALAVAVANSPQIGAAFHDGVAWLALGPQPDLFALLGQLLTDFGAPFADLIDANSRAVRLRQTLAHKRCLLILDDVWRKAHAQPFLEAIRPPARALFTTRRPQVASDLHAANHEVPVLLAAPALELLAAPALELLAAVGSEAASAVDADRSGAGQLAADLGWLPLALKVAGRRLQALARSGDPRTAVQHLRGEVEHRLLALTTPEAHAGLASEEPSLEAILALSYDALPDEETRRALRRMAVCGGQPLDVDAACLAAVWQIDADQTQTLIAALVDAGLLEVSRRQGAPRYALHQVMGVFAATRLATDAAEQQTAILAHAGHFADLVAGYDAAIKAGRMTYSAPLEWVNVVYAIETLCRLAAHDDAAGHALLAFAQNWRNVLFNNHHPRRLHWLNMAVQTATRLGDAWQQANVLKAQGDVLAFLDERAQALEKYEEALGLFRAVGDRLGEANVLKAQGDVLSFLKQTAQALEKYEEALGLFRAVGARLGEANVLKAQGDVLAFLDERAQALEKYEEALGLFRAVGARLGEANVLKAQGDVLAFLDERAQALEKYEEALGLFRAVGARLGEANVLSAQGQIALVDGRQSEADELLTHAIALYNASGSRYSVPAQIGNYGWALLRNGQPDRARNK
jgi:tetratricopeptide (TPR) repeat protein